VCRPWAPAQFASEKNCCRSFTCLGLGRIVLLWTVVVGSVVTVVVAAASHPSGRKSSLQSVMPLGNLCNCHFMKTTEKELQVLNSWIGDSRIVLVVAAVIVVALICSIVVVVVVVPHG